MPAVPALYCYQYKVAKIMDGLGLRLNRSSQSASVNEFVVFVRKITCLEACAVKKNSVENCLSEDVLTVSKQNQEL